MLKGCLHPPPLLRVQGKPVTAQEGEPLLPVRRLWDPAQAISDPFSSSWETRLSGPCLESPSHTCFESSLFALNLSFKLIYPMGSSSLSV